MGISKKRPADPRVGEIEGREPTTQDLCGRDEPELVETTEDICRRSVDHGAQGFVIEFCHHPSYPCSVEELGSGAQGELEGRQVIGKAHPIPQLLRAGWIAESEAGCLEKASAED